MDSYNLPDQVPSPMINLKSSDGEIFEVEVKVVHLFRTIKEMLDELGVEESEVISVPQNAPEISGTILGKILEWGNHHKDDPAAAEDDEKDVKPTDDIRSWDAEFLIQVDQTTLFQIIRAANFLNIKGLLDVACKKVAKMIKGMALEEVRRTFQIQNDFSPDEEKQVRKENGWCDFDCPTNDSMAVDGSVLDKTLADSVQDMDNEDMQVIQDCLKNSVVVRKIFQHFSNPELVKLSTMNQMWSYEARLMMRHRGNVMARLVCYNTRPCHEVFGAFGADLEQMNVVLYSEMSVVISPKSHAVGTEALDRTYEVILARLPLKRFSLRLPGEWCNCKDCPGLSLLKKLLQHFSGTLEELTLDIEEEGKKFVENFFGDCSLSGLKVLNLQEDYDTLDESYTNYMRALVLRAPALRELHTSGPINLKENVLEGSQAVLMPQHEISAPFDEISESVVRTLRLEDVQLMYTGPEFNLDTFNRMAPMLLQESCTRTLGSMSVDGILAVPLMCYGISLENVIDLGIYLNYILSELCQPHLMMIFKKFDFTRLFPSLEKVRICYSFNYVRPSVDHMLAITMQAIPVLVQPCLPDRAANIRELTLYQKYISVSAVQFFAEMFPDIQKLVIESDGEEEEEIPFGSIWEHWPNLEELQVDGKLSESTANLDSIFCGILPEEVAQLRQKDEEYLKSVNIVPVMPSITSLKNIKTFTLKLNRYEESDEPFVDDGTFIFSKITGLIVFARCSSLAVNLEFTTRGVLPVSHLKPFASVKCFDPSPYEDPDLIASQVGNMAGYLQQMERALLIGAGVDFESD